MYAKKKNNQKALGIKSWNNVFVSPVRYGQCRIINVCEILEEQGAHIISHIYRAGFFLLNFTENYRSNSPSLSDEAN